jgi:hypothetical protein
MRRSIATLAAIGLALTLAACKSSTVTLNYADKENPTRVTSISGLKSHDAANVANFGTYANAKAVEKQKEACSIEAQPTGTIELKGIKQFTCYSGGPSDDGLAKPTQARSEFVENMDATGRLIQKATPVVLGGMALSDRNSQRDSNERIAEINAQTEREENASDAAQTSALVEALAEKPPFFVLPPGATPVAP